MMRFAFICFLFATFIVWVGFPKPSTSSDYKATTLVDFGEVVWSFSFVNEKEVLVSLRSGSLYHVNIATKQKTKLSSPKTEEHGQGGLLDVHYIADGGYVYVTYSEEHNGLYTTSLARGVLKGQTLQGLETLFSAKAYGEGGRHFGSRLLFKDGFIFMTIGGRGERDLAQDLSHHHGTILRLTMDGKAAPGNPYENDAQALPEIWSFGHRNPQGIDIDPVSGEIYSIEFGPRGGDELNHIKKATNYGWPVITYGKEYWGPSIGETHKEGMEQPIKHWTPSISPSGMAFYTSDNIAAWKNNLFVAALGEEHLRRLEMQDGKVVAEEVLFADLGERIRHVRTGPDGWLYFATDSGKLMRVHR